MTEQEYDCALAQQNHEGSQSISSADRLANFARKYDTLLVPGNESLSSDYWNRGIHQHSKYSREEIESIINYGTLDAQQELSRYFFEQNGYYAQILTHYATLLTYAGILVPHVASSSNSLQSKSNKKRYQNALEFVANSNIPTMCKDFALKALINGAYYGLLLSVDKTKFVVLDLPEGYARSRFKDVSGHDLIEFDLGYFNKITDETQRKITLKAYPQFIEKGYYAWIKNKKAACRWLLLPAEVGVCFKWFSLKPMFLNIIPAALDYDDAVDTSNEKALDQIRKIVIQQVPHLNDGRLLFEPDEAESMHKAAVGMMRGQKNVRVLTTYADVQVADSKTSDTDDANRLKIIKSNIYSQGGVSGEIFAASTSSTINISLQNDLSLMMYLGNKFSYAISNIINMVYGNGSVTFSYEILPISYFNQFDYSKEAFKLSQSGYSFFLPAIALGVDQRNLVDLKDVENELVNLADKLVPLQSAYTQSASSNESGRPTKAGEDKADVTVRTEDQRS